MSLTDQRAAYEDCYRLYQRAVDSRKGAGVRVPFPTENEAKFFALRMNKARSRASSRARSEVPMLLRYASPATAR